MAAKRIIFSNEAPNDQGGIIPNDSLDFSRYLKNPVILPGHDWNALPLGLMSDIKFDGTNWTGFPEFHGLTDESKTYKKLWDAEQLKACSIGGECIWKGKTGIDGNKEYFENAEGLRVAERFMLYEISMVTLPSNPDALALAAKIYQIEELTQVTDSVTSNIVKLNSKLQTLKSEQMDEEAKKDELRAKKEVDEEAKAEADKLATEKKAKEVAAKAEADAKLAADEAEKNRDNSKHVILESKITGIPWLDKLLNLRSAAAKLGIELPIQNEEGGGDPIISTILPDEKLPLLPIGLKTKYEKVQKAKKEAEKAIEDLEKAKKAYEAEETEETEKAYKAAGDVCEKAIKEAEEAEKAYEAESEEAEKSKKEAEKVKKDAEEAEKAKNAADKDNKITLKTIEQMKEEKISLAAKPDLTRRIEVAGMGKSFTELRAELKKDHTSPSGKVIMRALAGDVKEKDPTDYIVLAKSILSDPRYSHIVDKVRFMQNVDERKISGLRSNLNVRQGYTLREVTERLVSGNSEYMNYNSNRMERMTTLGGGTNYALANPDLVAIEWLALAIFKLFPDNTWKSDIPVFAVAQTSANTGIIWGNVAADPTITKGTKPSPNTDYTYSDTAVSLKLTPYWLQPMNWEPLTMHQLRYDQMATGWAQAFAKWDAQMDDDLLYTLASTVPAASMVNTTGTGFAIASATDPDQFYWNTAFTGTLAKPTLNDLIRIEQIYKKQNFELESLGAVIVLDPTAESYIAQDSEVKNKLTEWKTLTGGSFLKFRNTVMHTRSRVAIYDPASGLVKDWAGVIPSTSTGANVSFIPSQVGIGIGLLDVFMIQDPTTYGYRMSADIRKGIVPLRANYNGTALLNYGTPSI